jgi:hypothetical protein
VTGLQKLWDDGRTDVARRAGYENTHGRSPISLDGSN